MLGSDIVTERMYPLRHHPVQAEYWTSPYRFNIIPSGRRSGKTELAGKRKAVLKAIRGISKAGRRVLDYKVGICAPTRDQVKRIYWDDLKQIINPKLIKKISEQALFIKLLHGPEIWLHGMDKPQRIEGSPWDHIVLDEYANMKSKVWQEHVMPALADRNGTCDFIGVPEGRNHYYDLWKAAESDPLNLWGRFTWKSSEILSEEQIKHYKHTLDPLIYQQEMEGSFVLFAGRLYHAYDERYNLERVDYDPNGDLILCFDFNVSPGVAIICQEFPMEDSYNDSITCVIGEVYIPKHSNTLLVCDRIIQDWGGHQGKIYAYGDATGGHGGSASVLGSDWDLIHQKLGSRFGFNRFRLNVSPGNPPVRDRVNALNSRLCSLDKTVRLLIDPTKAPRTVKDFEGVKVLEGSAGEIDKSDLELTHLTDAIGYYCHEEFPIVSEDSYEQKVYGT